MSEKYQDQQPKPLHSCRADESSKMDPLMDADSTCGQSVVVSQELKREDIDPSEDSGFSSISDKSVTNEKDGVPKIADDTVKFVDPLLLEEEQRKKLEKKKKKSQDPELLAEKRLAREAYEREIQEQQYKRLMHLLTKSKALHSFMLQKNDEQEKKNKKRIINTKSEKEPPKKRGRKAKNAPKQIDNVPKRNKFNLSEEDIKEELLAMSDEENANENHMQSNKKFVQPKYFKGQLRDHQIAGLNWLKRLFENGLNGILADEMGLGKTIQVIALFAYLIEKHIPGPYLIVVPLSTLANWKTEFERFAPELPVVIYYGNEPARQLLRPKISKKVRISETFNSLPIVIATYEMPVFDTAFLRQFNWKYIVVDEAQRIKNYKTQLFKILKSFNSLNRLLLTGTPLQNNLSELWSLLNFLLPEIFDNLGVFEAWFDAKSVQNEEGKEKFLKQEQEKQVLTTLREILQPFMLRRLKEEACPDIPPLKEVIIYTPLTSVQYELYVAILNRDLAKLHKVKEESVIVDVDGVRPKRKCTTKICLDDYLNEPVKNIDKKVEIQKEMWSKFTDVTEDNLQYFIRLRFGNDMILYKHVINHPYIIHYPLDYSGLAKVDDDLIKVSGKMLVLDLMLKKLKSNGHKVLLFSTMSMVLDIIEDYLSMRDYKYVRLDGSVNYEDRRDNIDEFQTNPEVFLFLLTTKAGAVGLNLAAADTVIIYDSDWNPQNDIQAMSRCHRIGQSKPVVVYRMCTKGTIDEEVIKRAAAKRFLEKAVIHKESGLVNSEEGLMKLKTMLNENLFKVTDSKTSVYSDDELNQLLDRSDMVQSKKELEV